MADTFGLTAQGLLIKTQEQIDSEISAAFQTTFGENVNLAPRSVFGQLKGIMSEREALLWELLQAVYASQYPSGAEGTSVDNILALNNMKRLPALPTVTAPQIVVQDNGIPLYPLVLRGTAGTTIPAGSIINTTASPPLAFTLDQDVLIAAAINCVQSIFFSNVPDSGQFTLSIVDANGVTLTTPSIPFNAKANQSFFSFSATPVTGNYQLVLTSGGVAETTANIPFGSNAAAVQAAINALGGYSGVTVTGSVGAGFTITWGAISNPTLGVTGNTTGTTISPIDSVQASLNNLVDGSSYPYADVTVVATSLAFIVTFAGSAGAQAQALMTNPSNTLQMGSNVTNIGIEFSVQGAPAQGVGSATCTATGPNFVAADTLSVIGSPVSGWSTVNNDLDCTTGANVETDTAALTRRDEELASAANGPIQAIVEKVRAVPGVIQAIAFQNLTDAAQQIVTFASVPSSGTFRFTVEGRTTAPMAYNIDAAGFQAALRTLTGLGDTLVIGNMQFGFVIDFNGSLGGQAIDLGSVVFNTTGVSADVEFGRPPHSYEIVAQGGTDSAIAQAIYDSAPAGIRAYGSTSVQIEDDFGNLVNIAFSRPSEIPIYVTIALTTDQYLIPGNPLSGANPNAKFNKGSIVDIQNDIIGIGNQVPIGGLVIGFGSNGLIGAFNSVPGIISYTIAFDIVPSPSNTANIQMQPEQIALFEQFNVSVSYV